MIIQDFAKNLSQEDLKTQRNNFLRSDDEIGILTPSQVKLSEQLMKQRGGALAGVQAATAEGESAAEESVADPTQGISEIRFQAMTPEAQAQFKGRGGLVRTEEPLTAAEQLSGATQTMTPEQREQTVTAFKEEITKPFTESVTEEIGSAVQRIKENEERIASGEVSEIQGGIEGATEGAKSLIRVAYSPLQPIVQSAFEQEDVQEGINMIDTKLKEAGADVYDSMIEAGMSEEQANKTLNDIETSVKDSFTALKSTYDEAPPEVQSLLRTGLNLIEAGSEMYGGRKAKQITEEIGGETLEQLPKVVGAIEEGVTKTGGAIGTGLKQTEEVVSNIYKEIEDVVGKQVAKRNEKIISQTKKQIDDLAGTIAQGKKIDKPKTARALLDIDTSNVKNYSDVKDALSTKEATLSSELSNYLEEQRKILKLDEMSRVTDVNGTKVTENFVDDALNHLEELYAKSDKVAEQRVKNIRMKAEREGLSLKEINDLSKEYGIEFKNKAFTKVGEPRTTVSAPMYENTRKGIKDVVRSNVDGDVAKTIDSSLSDIINTKQLITKMEESVNKLKQKIKERSLGAKVGARLVDIADTLTLGGLKGTVARMLPRGVGFKTLNALDLEEQLVKNLDLLKSLDNLLEKKSVKLKDVEAIKPESFSQMATSKSAEVRPAIVTKRDDDFVVLEGTGRFVKSDKELDIFLPKGTTPPKGSVKVADDVPVDEVKRLNLISSRGKEGQAPEFVDLITKKDKVWTHYKVSKDKLKAPFVKD
jgi:hypothetical protein